MTGRSIIKQHSEEVQYSTNRGAQTVDQGCPKYFRFEILNTFTIKHKTVNILEVICTSQKQQKI